MHMSARSQSLDPATLDSLLKLRLFSELGAAQAEVLRREARLVTLAKGQRLFEVGDEPRWFYVLMGGCIQLQLEAPDDSANSVMCIARPGETFCDATALLGIAYHVSAEASSESKLIAIPRQTMLALLASGGQFALRMMERLSLRVQTLVQQVMDITLRNSTERVAGFLLDQAPRVNSRSYQLTLPTSKQAVASRLNLSKETFSRVLREFREQGVIEVSGRLITVLDRERLRELRP
jgi:CRP-like cAMP-binding protein